MVSMVPTEVLPSRVSSKNLRMKKTVMMLDALPEEERLFYVAESSVVDWSGKSQAIFDELEQRFAFIGGTLDQRLAYLHRPLPANMWQWALASQVKAYAGFSVVPKKDPSRQRKLLMVVATNYARAGVSERSRLCLFWWIGIGVDPCPWGLAALRLL